jgi:3-deoxy-D-manno-octulosonic acid (KDO) 8-phosphate synthase
MRQMLRRVSPEAADQAVEEMPGLGAVRGDVPDAVKQAAAASGRAGQVIEKHEAPKKASKDSDKRRPARRAARPARRSPEK